ncbi:DUF6146 family protein [Aquimarina sp. ERC-38]|uniref:DUF6146 family protein n=1 Tax=Aquimarina sp. ERC-38 TaxID=2949996 RepID=UPI002246B9EE|nr:DUF6146 family protein [Aquimarina sp. ERC-38]UZO79688.1 DUF6146 family protein [Aquimarina sp. ERC-38]
MKQYFYILILLIVIACTTTRNTAVSDNTSQNTLSDTLRIANDSLEYEIIIIEPGFNGWLVTQRPRGYYGKTFLRTRNIQYVQEYNQRVIQPNRFDPQIYQQQIDYQSQIDYGYEVDYLLYHYFLYMEQRLGQRFFRSRGVGF